MTNAINITIPPDLVIQLDRLAGKRGRSSYICHLIRKAVKPGDDEEDDIPLAVDVKDPEPVIEPEPERPNLLTPVQVAQVRNMVECPYHYKLRKHCVPGLCAIDGQPESCPELK